MSFVRFEQLPFILEKRYGWYGKRYGKTIGTICEKSKFACFVLKQGENELFPTQVRSEILFDLENTCHEQI